LGPHSWDAGVSPTTVIWVAHLPEGSAHLNLDDGSASLHARNICVFDAFTVLNSLNTARPMGNLVKGIINSLDIQWSGVRRRVTNFSDSANCFRGDFVENTAAIAVTATTPANISTQPNPNGPGCVTKKLDGFRFVSGPASGNLSDFAQIGRERNGVFF
jgi:hypothetical protein